VYGPRNPTDSTFPRASIIHCTHTTHCFFCNIFFFYYLLLFIYFNILSFDHIQTQHSYENARTHMMIQFCPETRYTAYYTVACVRAMCACVRVLVCALTNKDSAVRVVGDTSRDKSARSVRQTHSNDSIHIVRAYATVATGSTKRNGYFFYNYFYVCVCRAAREPLQQFTITGINCAYNFKRLKQNKKYSQQLRDIYKTF
jgi:hypothetical protein